jgi:hypothetical protein
MTPRVAEHRPGHQHQHQHDLTRRGFLGAVAGATVGLLLPPSVWLRAGPASAAVSGSLTGSNPLRLAMHVHGSWSEGPGSWEAQFTQAAANAFDVLYLTDHDMRSTAYRYATSLAEAAFVTSSTGSFAQRAATSGAGALRLLAESSSATAEAVLTMALQEKPFAFNRLRTSIAGLRIDHRTTSARLTGGARYDVVVLLSYHPARSGRPAGQYRLVYRFGGPAARWTESGGLVGVVRRPTPAAGSTQVLTPEQDVATFWPDMLAIDNAHFGMSFVARSPRRGDVADVRVASVSFTRTQSSASSVIANQARLVAAYQPRFPGLVARPQTEISQTLPDLNTFGMPQWIPDYDLLPADHDTRYRQIVSTVHARGGLISWNHPFGYGTGPLLAPAESVAKRRALFGSMQAVDRFGVDILEVGYTLRGQVDAATHLDLWDTFSRNGNFLTGNGASDDHSGQGWSTLTNGFATGVWAASTSEADIRAALAAGRAYVAHIGLWPGGQIDMLVDDAVPMGGVSVGSTTSRRMTLLAANLPAGSVVQLVRGPVDYTGAVDPGTSSPRTLAATAFVDGVAAFDVDTTYSRFFRPQVRLSTGELVGAGNPVWLLRSQPPGGIPPARAW